jgi:hypothetical protein
MSQKQITVTTALTAIAAGDNTMSVGIAPVVGSSPFFNVYDANQNLLTAINPNGTYTWSAPSGFFIPGQIVGYAAMAAGSGVFTVTDTNVLPKAVGLVAPAENVVAATGAIFAKTGAAFITYNGGAGGYTLALPTPGLDDNKQLEIISTTAQAHVVTTPANGFNGSLHIATWGAAIGNSLTIRAFNGSWYVANTIGITIS